MSDLPVRLWFLAGIGLVVLAVVGLSMMPQCSGCQYEKEPRDVLRGDLRELQTAQEIHYSATLDDPDSAHAGQYATEVSALGFEPSEGVHVRLSSADPATGYAAVASLRGSTLLCSVWVGEENRTPPAVEAGTSACTGGEGRPDGTE